MMTNGKTDRQESLYQVRRRSRCRRLHEVPSPRGNGWRSSQMTVRPPANRNNSSLNWQTIFLTQKIYWSMRTTSVVPLRPTPRPSSLWHWRRTGLRCKPRKAMPSTSLPGPALSVWVTMDYLAMKMAWIWTKPCLNWSTTQEMFGRTSFRSIGRTLSAWAITTPRRGVLSCVRTAMTLLPP